MPLPIGAVLRLYPGVELSVLRPDFGVVQGVRAASPYAIVEGPVADLEAILSAVESHGAVERIVEALSARLPREAVLATLEKLVSAGFARLDAETDRSAARRARVAVLGGGRLAHAIEARLAEMASIDAALLDFEPDSDQVRSELAGAEIWVAALEGVPYAALERVGEVASALGRACLYVSYESGAVTVGPLLPAERGGGVLAARRHALARSGAGAPAAVVEALPLLRAGTLPAEGADPRLLAERAAFEAAAEVARVLEASSVPRLVDAVLILRGGGADVCEVPPAEARAPRAAPTGRDLELEADVIEARAANLRERSDGPLPTRVRSVGIVGGGTAGYLTALALRAQLPELEVTLIDSSKIPVIGVGEATTALLNHFLHSYLGLDIVDFYARVRPTWKLGIRFEWGLPGDYYFNSPFQFGKLLEALIYDRDINTNCLGSRLMTLNTTPIVRTRDGGTRSLLGEVPYAYHLDNRRFVRYLGEEARRAGVRHLDAVVTEAVPAADRRGIDHLRTEDGRELRYDLYVDCSGFRSLLLGKALGASYVSYTPSLFTDTAVVADVPHGGLVKPYTVAETMDHGWCWSIPMEDCDHRGYVFASAFASVEQAAAEMRAKNPGMGDFWTVKFRSGRHEEFWRGNCVAIGNSFAFVEPLQSTAIHMIIVEIKKLISTFPREASLRAFQSLANREVIEVWDTLRWFLGAHYRYNGKLDTPFWQECRRAADVSGIQEVIDVYQERAPIGATAHRFKELDLSTFGAYRHDLLFMGMGMPTTYATPLEDEATWRRASDATARVAARALPHLEALEVLRRDPEMLRRHGTELARI